jgi:hypothetical protein
MLNNQHANSAHETLEKGKILREATAQIDPPTIKGICRHTVRGIAAISPDIFLSKEKQGSCLSL